MPFPATNVSALNVFANACIHAYALKEPAVLIYGDEGSNHLCSVAELEISHRMRSCNDTFCV